jgi:hypothetical protein
MAFVVAIHVAFVADVIQLGIGFVAAVIQLGIGFVAAVIMSVTFVPLTRNSSVYKGSRTTGRPHHVAPHPVACGFVT